MNNDRIELALAKARNRGKIAEEWFKKNELTPQNMVEFKKLMKKADKEFNS